MSVSSRVNISKTGLVKGLVAAIAACALIVGYGLWESAKYERQSNDKAAEYEEYTRKKIAETCVGIPTREKAECRYEAFDAQREYRNNQRDLIAQRQSALWAYIMGTAAVIGMALSAFGIILIWLTFREQEKANINAVNSAAAAAIETAKAIGHAERTADAARLTAESGRAWMTKSMVRFGSLSNSTIGGQEIKNGMFAQVEWSNSGRSPALNVSIYTSWQSTPKGHAPPLFPEPEHDISQANTVVAVGEKVDSVGHFIPDDITTAFRRKEIDIAVYCHVRYRDIYSLTDRISECTFMLSYWGIDINAPIKAGTGAEGNTITVAIGPQNRVV